MRSTRTRGPLARPLAGLLALLVCGFVATGGTGGAAAQADGNDPGKLVLVMDSSGSMKEPASGGETKIAAARTALRSVIAGLPAEQPVGLRVYGATVFSRSDSGACTDSQLKVPVAVDNRRQLLSAVASYKPYGETPIGYALQQAGDDLGSSGKRNIVLVSDGEPTCEPDPCKVAKTLAAGGIDLRIDVVGLDVGAQARHALQCIADAGRGTYYDVANSRDFADSLEKVATRAARPFATIGRPVTGTSTAVDAPTIGNGDWQDRTDGSSERYYLVKRTRPGSTLHVSAAFRDPDTTVFNRIQLTTPDGDICEASGAVEQLATNTLISAAAAAGPIDTFGDYDAASPCATAATLVAKVGYSGRSLGVPVEIRVTELPPVRDAASLPRPVNKPRWVEPPTGQAKQTRGGSSFDDPPLLAPGSYRDDIVQGETLTYQVDVDWGQQLTARVGLPALTGQRAAAATGSPLVSLSVFSPARTPAGASSVDSHFARAILTRYGHELGTVAGPVAFLNTSESDPALHGSDLAGRYTVTVFLGKKPGGRSVPVPFTMRLGVSGSPHGEPQFASAPVSPGSSPSSSASAGSSSPAPEQSPGHASGPTDGGGFPTGVLLGALGAVALAAAAVLTLRSVHARA